MKYLYYPGCSLKSSGRSYEESILPVFKALGSELVEMDGWNCCGATSYMSIDDTVAISLITRNLALAEKQQKEKNIGNHNLIAPCAACYMGLIKAQKYLIENAELKANVLKNLNNAGLPCESEKTISIRHPLDIIVNEIGIDKIKSAVKKPLAGKKVASYYGCQIVRPYSEFDDARDPQTMDRIVEALGGEPIDWPLKTRCCSGTMTSTLPDSGLRLNYLLLKEAKKRGADTIITACPLCQFNLECFQGKINRAYKDNIDISVMYFTQLMGMAFGLEKKEIGLHRMLCKV